ncbi:hypothetical protein M9H77_14223 [Catharanthus roseus]|uniref:Uncharacterized protein n=1 Tax=Catharanthus roseus TaxID=4058 RepID=A0ACC0BML8_CATRO|nr:hypothetical protein M9H77_14223 [Catharanthus roseus]
MSTQAQAPTPFREESSNSQCDDPLRVIMQELQSLRDVMRDIRRDVTNLSNKQREVSPHGSLNVTTPRNNGLFNCSRKTEFHQPLHFDEELHPPPYGGRRGGFGGRGIPRESEEVPRLQARHGEPLYDDHEHANQEIFEDKEIGYYIVEPVGIIHRFPMGAFKKSQNAESDRKKLTSGKRCCSDHQQHKIPLVDFEIILQEEI